MKPLQDLAEERRRILDQMRHLATEVAGVVAGDIDSLTRGVEMLEALRKAAHEETNQLQHEALIVEAACQLEKEFDGAAIEWSWNPRQTGTVDEPDLRGTVSGKIVISLEATASELPRGVIDRRMKRTLGKLSGFRGRKVYCVRTPQMHRRALTKVQKAGYDIEVWLISPGPDV